jgi:hypothetical protein
MNNTLSYYSDHNAIDYTVTNVRLHGYMKYIQFWLLSLLWT